MASYMQEESRIASALSLANNHPDPNLSKIASKAGVSYCRLRLRYLGESSRSTRKPAGKKLTEVQEREILNKISQPNHNTIKQIANQVLERDHIGDTPPPTVSSTWCKRFKKRYSQLKASVGNPVLHNLPCTPSLSTASSERSQQAHATNTLRLAASALEQTQDILHVETTAIPRIENDSQALYHISEHSAVSSQTSTQALANRRAGLSFVGEAHMLLQPPRSASSEDCAISPNTHPSFAGNSFRLNPIQDYPSDPYILSPPKSLLVSEKLFFYTRVHFQNASRRMHFDDYENPLTLRGTKLDNTLCDDFDSYCFTATMFFEKGLYVEFRRSLSKASALVEQILRAEHPRTLACFLEVFIHLMQTGLPEIAFYLCDYIKRMSAKVTKEGLPWGQIYRLLGELDSEYLDQAMAQIWKCTTDVFDCELGMTNRFAVSARLDYIKRVVTDHLEEERLLRNLLGQLGGVPLPTPRVMLNLAHNLSKQGRHKEAEGMARRVLSLLQDEVYAGRIVEKIESLKIVSRSQFNQSLTSAAEKTMRMAIRMIMDQFGKRHSWVLEFMNVLEGWLRGWGREVDANALQGEIEELMGNDEM